MIGPPDNLKFNIQPQAGFPEIDNVSIIINHHVYGLGIFRLELVLRLLYCSLLYLPGE